MSRIKKEFVKRIKHQERKRKQNLEKKSLSRQHGKYYNMPREGILGKRDLTDYLDIFSQIAEKIDPSEVNDFKRIYGEPSKNNYQKLKQKDREVFYKED